MSIFSFLRRFTEETAQETIAEAAIKGFGGIVKSLFSTEEASKRILDYMDKVMDPDKEDERVVQEAKTKMDPADVTRWNKKMALLADGVTSQMALLRHNAVRQTLQLRDVDKCAEGMTRIARLSPEDFARERVENGWDCSNPALSFQTIVDTVARRQQHINAAFAAHPIRSQVAAWRDQAVAESKKQTW